MIERWPGDGLCRVLANLDKIGSIWGLHWVRLGPPGDPRFFRVRMVHPMTFEEGEG